MTLNGTFTNAPRGNYETFTIYATSYIPTIEIMPVLWLDALGSVPALLDTSSGKLSYWGITLANPLDRNVTVYSVGVVATTVPIFAPLTLVGINPSTGWSARATSAYAIVYWDATVGIIVSPHSAYNFTFKIEIRAAALEMPVVMEAVTSEGKFVKPLATSVDSTYPTINLYYTKNPASPTTDQRYALLNIASSVKRTYNVTVYNSGKNDLNSKVNLLILLPAGWTDLAASNQTKTGWDYSSQTITQEPDGSCLISISSTSSKLAGGSYLVYSFSATSPTVTKATLYTFMTTAYYPSFTPSLTAAFCLCILQVKP